MRSTEAVLFLVGPAVGVSDEAGTQAARDALLMRTKRLPDAASVAEFLEKQMNNYLAGQLPAEPDADELIPLWMWNENETLAELKRYPREDASLIYAARLATQLARLVPKSPENRKRTMLVRLEAERNLNGLDNPPVNDATSAYAEAAKSETTFLDEVLQMALKERRYGAATSVIEIMGASGDSLLLQRKQGPHATLIDALNCSDQRTQFAALQAVSALADEHPFAGSSRVVETAAYLLTGQGQPTILVAHPRLEEGTRIATLFTDLGFTSEIATHGNELARRAKANADIELILASDLLHRPSVLEATQMLRQDIHSAAIPLGILRHEAEQGSTYWNDVNVIHMGQHLGGLNAANAWAPPGIIRARGADAAKDADKLAEVISPPQSLDTARWQVQHLQKLGGRRIVPSEVRAERASLVLDTILKLVSQDPPTKYHDFQRLELALQAACDNTSLMERALQALGKIGSPQAQLFLAQQASLRGLAEANRKAAIAALEIAVKKRGLLLTQARLEMQYIMFNESRESDVEHSAILGELLDVVESPLKQRTALE
jgi:CheY-like chemotaxis protein